MLIFGEVIPKAVASEWATALILRLYRVLEIAALILSPVTWGARALVTGVLVALGLRTSGVRQLVSREELELLLQRAPDEAAGQLRARDQAHRRAPARDAEGPPPDGGGHRRVRGGGRHRDRGRHRGASGGRDPGRTRPHGGDRGAPARWQLSRGRAGARAGS